MSYSSISIPTAPRIHEPFQITLIGEGKAADGQALAVVGDGFRVEHRIGIILFESERAEVTFVDADTGRFELTFTSHGGYTAGGAHELRFKNVLDPSACYATTITVNAAPATRHATTDAYRPEPPKPDDDPAHGIPPLPVPPPDPVDSLPPALPPPSTMIKGVTQDGPAADDEDKGKKKKTKEKKGLDKVNWAVVVVILSVAAVIIGGGLLFRSCESNPDNNATVWTKGSVEAAKQKMAADKVRKAAEKDAFDKQQADLKAAAEAKALADKQNAEAADVQAALDSDASSATDEDATNTPHKKKKKYMLDNGEPGPEFVHEAPGHL